MTEIVLRIEEVEEIARKNRRRLLRTASLYRTGHSSGRRKLEDSLRLALLAYEASRAVIEPVEWSSEERVLKLRSREGLGKEGLKNNYSGREENFTRYLYRVMVAEVLPKLRRIADEARRYLYFIGWLNSELEKRGIGRIIVTGGFAVEVYTGRAYRTMDVDIIVEGEKAAKIIEEFLASFSEKLARGYLPREDILAFKSIDIVSTSYTRVKPPVRLVLNDYYIYMDPPEELIILYLAGWKYWGSSEDRDKALWLLGAWGSRIDREYLERRALEERVEDKLRELEELLKKAEE